MKNKLWHLIRIESGSEDDRSLSSGFSFVNLKTAIEHVVHAEYLPLNSMHDIFETHHYS